MTSSLKIAGASLNQIPMDWENNTSNIREAILQAREEQAAILCLPELCITGYGCEDMFLSPWLIQKATQKLFEITPYTKNITVTAGLPIRFRETIYNAICVIQDCQILGFYAKQKLANDGVHYEPRWFTPWPSGVIDTIQMKGVSYPIGHITIAVGSVNVGFEICEDAWRNDRPGLHQLNEHVDLFLNPSASHFAFGKAAYREKLVKESSEKLKAAYLYTNLLGNESGRMIYDGDILVAQKGQLLARNKRLSFRNVNLLSIDVDLTGTEKNKEKVAADYPNSYSEFSQAAALALFDYLRKSKSKGFVLSLSGGADSSSIAVLVAEMVRKALEELGSEVLKEKLTIPSEIYSEKEWVGHLLHTAYQGTKNSSKETLNSAKQLAKSIGATFHHWEIDEAIGSYQKNIEHALSRKLSWEQDDIALQNIQARARSPIIWMLANINKALLLTTSNRSEGDVGYATMDGDTSGSISPIAAVSKTFILSWLKYAEQELGYTGLAAVNSLAPTAELRPKEMHQTDEVDLMPYPVLLEIEKLAIREKKSPLEVFELLKSGNQKDDASLKTWITKFFTLWSINQWKRERIAPSFHLDDFNVDPRTWCRFPILSSGFKEELKDLNQGTGS